MRRAGEVDQAAVERVEVELAEAEVAFAERERQHEALLSEVSADVALGACSAGDGATRTRPSEHALDLARGHVAQLRRAVPELRQRLAAREQREREEQERAVAKALADGCRKANAAATKLQTVLGEADQAAQALERQRDEVDRLAAKSAGARDDVSPPAGARRSASTGRTPPPGWSDEPLWADGIDVLRRVLADGPRRPHADGEARAQAQDMEREKQARELLSWLRVQPSSRARLLLAQGNLPEVVQAEVDAILAEAHEHAEVTT